MVVIAGEHAKNTKIGSLKKCEKFYFFSANLQCQTCREDKKLFEIKLKNFFFCAHPKMQIRGNNTPS